MRRIVSLITLASFLMLAGIDTLHHHATHQEKSHCSTCKVIAQSSALPNPTPAQKPEAISAAAVVSNDLPLFLHVVSASHGLSPPVC